MKSAFQWQGHASILGQQFTKQPKKPDLEPKRLHIWSKSELSDATREAQIAQVNREVEHNFLLAQDASISDEQRALHRSYARELAAKVRTLVQGRSEAFVAQLEQERGLV